MANGSDQVAALTARAVSWRPRRSSAPIVDGVSLDVRRGEVVGLLGRNGAGKTTTLLLLVGLLRPSRGTVRVLGVDPRARGDAGVRGRIGWAPAVLEGCDPLAVGELLALHASLLRLPRPEGRRRALGLAERLELSAMLRRRVGLLSTGERQRVLLALAELGAPEVLVLDEPSAGLDPFGLALVRDLLAHARSRGAAVLVSSHQLGEVERCCDRALFVAGGRVVHEVGQAELGALARRAGAPAEEGAGSGAAGRGGASERGASVRDLEAVFREVLR
jgi:ABC-2 type transport system ATP-binding protein